jgi:hypothetical protein
MNLEEFLKAQINKAERIGHRAVRYGVADLTTYLIQMSPIRHPEFWRGGKNDFMPELPSHRPAGGYKNNWNVTTFSFDLNLQREADASGSGALAEVARLQTNHGLDGVKPKRYIIYNNARSKPNSRNPQKYYAEAVEKWDGHGNGGATWAYVMPSPTATSPDAVLGDNITASDIDAAMTQGLRKAIMEYKQ